MLANQNRVLPKDAIAEHIYGNDIAAADSFDFLYSHVKNLKKKLNQVGVGNYIKSVYGIGYKFEAVE
jgi:DNA-binding response OmpR family regulator